MSGLSSIRIYLGILDNSEDDLLNLLFQMAKDDIKGHCLIDEFVPELENAAIKLTAIYYNKRKRNIDGFSQISQGSRSASSSNNIPVEIQNMIQPFKRVRVRG